MIFLALKSLILLVQNLRLWAWLHVKRKTFAFALLYFVMCHKQMRLEVKMHN